MFEFFMILYYHIFLCYSIISYNQHYYGEAILYVFILIPIYIYGIIHWLQNRSNKNNVVIVRGNLTKKEWCVLFVFFLITSLISYYILKQLDTSELFISTLSFITALPALYLLARRSKWNQVAFLVNDFIVPLLWISLAIKGYLIFIPMCIYHIFQITYDIYGLIEWIKLEKIQKEDK
jgi:nicotinamide mononucleotide transporter